MTILCAKITFDKKHYKNGKIPTEFLKLTIDSIPGFIESVKSDRPAVFVIPITDVETLIEMDDIIDYLGIKNDSIGLTRYLEKSDKKRIPLLSGKYSKINMRVDNGERIRIGKVLNSFNTLLKNWEEKNITVNPYNAFIMGLEEILFKEIFEKSGNPFYEEFEKKLFGLAAVEKQASKKILNITKSSETLSQVLIGTTEAMNRVRKQIIRAGKHTQHVLLLGESGTGKSMVARLLHDHSILNAHPFITVSCGAVTGTLFESELFGHVSGAFTEAKNDRKGLWREAENGTLFFDEIGDLPLDQQAKILVAIGRNVIRPVGSDKEEKVNARLIFATNRDLFAMMKQGTFREDLYWRIRYIAIVMPPLREQKGSIRYIAQKLWEKIKRYPEDEGLSPEILNKLEQVNWTGNIRSLKAVLGNLYYWNPEKQPKDLKDLNGTLGELQMGTEETCSKCASENSENEVDMHRIKCLRNLKNTEEMVRSCQILFEPYTEKTSSPSLIEKLDERLLLNRLEQIKTLTAEPLLFYKEDPFILINNLQGKLAYFSGLIEKKLWSQAQDYLNKELFDLLKKSQSVIFSSIQELMK